MRATQVGRLRLELGFQAQAQLQHALLAAAQQRQDAVRGQVRSGSLKSNQSRKLAPSVSLPSTTFEYSRPVDHRCSRMSASRSAFSA